MAGGHLARQQSQAPIVPAPAVSVVDTTAHYTLHRGAGVWCDEHGTKAANYLIDYCRNNLGFPLRMVNRKADADICLQKLSNGIGCSRDTYVMSVDEKGVTIGANEEQGVFLGVMTLLQLLPSRPGDVPVLNYTAIADNSRYSYRGMHLDVVRHWFPVSFVKKFIDMMARHKLNVFHWHLTDDQGWRIELKSHPELTERGSYRAGEIKGIFPGEYYDRPYEAYYTQEEIKEVIEYAAERYVTVIPEIDIPGHCMAVLAVHPEFSTTPTEPKHTAQTWGIFNRQNNVLAPSDEVFSFLDDVFNEVCGLFPGRYIHVGGDECAPRWWNESQATQQYMRDHDIKDAHALQTHFMRHVQQVCRAHGKQVIGWDGGAEGMDPEDGIIMSWHVRPNMPRERIDTTHRWINASGRYFYFTSREDSTQRELAPGQDRGYTLPVKTVYESQVMPDSASVQAQGNLMGLEGCCWTEYSPDPWKVEKMVFPRIAALAEKAWCGNDLGWEHFEPRLIRLLDYYDLWGVRYNPAVEQSAATKRNR
ncbi:MAG: beta-N-acetylhexosaminidase [Muribaculaceae bacterium]|nr:beta-N-acetylhexosaminidase [Muribaculaceae bacterium]